MLVRVGVLLVVAAAAFTTCDSSGGAPATSPDAMFEDAVADLTPAPEDGVRADSPALDDFTDPDLPPPPIVVLMSGFEPFGGYETNPSMDALWALEGQVIAGLEIQVVELPVEWDVAWELLHDAIRTLHPRVVIATGMAGGDEMRYEIHAVNEKWGTDNAGVNPKGEPVVPEGPEALGPTIPVETMAAAAEHAGFPTTISDDAGTYLCNYVMYHLLHYTLNDSPEPLEAGFVHVPPAPYEGPMSIQDITDAHIIGLDVIATWLEEDAPQYKPVPRTSTPPVYFLPGYE